ncbi:PREDICTED: altered inheritance of mitochondria protein 21-like isoform X1 [Camelina sativa]|uniref:Altered inheritance of mitochondria protein 21-like isoform X1 n=1 Tax=Camelina sativa TaxID=90675 RepID=A0ABM0W0X6_CAMSA|nr:PREDICTED: altered inheritance of mitochondria protein 21-like isoform X2 [Camelina sativa]XP_010464146.1 PREDICTED: altered inheritance of mitochondria protein 21-like isoform X1 [Camelina sativa]
MQPLENKVNEEAKLMEKEIGSSDSANVVNDKPALDSNIEVNKEETIDQIPAGEPEKESPAVVVEVEAVVKAEESTESEKHANGERGAEEVELKEPTLVKEGVAEVNVDAEKPTVENVVEVNNKDETKIVDVPDSADEAGGKLVEPVDVQSVRDVSAETAEEKIKDVEALEVEPKPEASEKVETQPEKVKELAPDVEVVKAEETPETTEQAKVELEGKLEDINVVATDSGINSKDERISESDSALCPEEIVSTNQESATDPKKDIEGDASSPADVIEKAVTEEKHVVDEPSKDEKMSESGAALCPEEIVLATKQESDTVPKNETEGDASSPIVVIEKAITEEKHVVDENTSEAGAALCPEKVVPSNQESDTVPKEEIDGGASSPADIIEKAITEEKHAVDEPSKDATASGSALVPEKVVPSNEVSDTNSKEETEGDASAPTDVIEKAITEEKHVVDEPSKDENPSESGSALFPETVVPTNQDSDTTPKKETEGDVSYPADVIENAITEEKHVVEEPSKDEQETVSEAKDVVTKLATEGENIKKDTESLAAVIKSEETLKETDTESGEKETAATKQEEVAEVVETAPVVKESDEPKQQTEVTAKEVPVKQKHSNSIISKVKQSLVKAKKAIIGKSPSSKTITTEEAKEEIKVK